MLSGMLIVLTFVSVIIISFLVSSLFVTATSATGYLQNIIFSGKPVPTNWPGWPSTFRQLGVFAASFWKSYVIAGLLGTFCTWFKLMDNQAEAYFLFYVVHIHRVFLYWLGVLLSGCYAFMLLKLKHSIVFNTFSPDDITTYSFWSLSLGYVVVSLFAAAILRQTWLFFYRIFLNEPVPVEDEPIDYEQ